MGKSSLICCVVVVAAALLQLTAAQIKHTVGDTIGWQIPPGGAIAYSTWASNQSFAVGDSLVFNFTSGSHDVVEVTAAAFNNCSTNSPIGQLITTGPATITLSTAGQHYFICTFSQHCLLGQKLAVNVTGTATPPASPPTQPATPPSSPAPAPATPPSSPAPAPSSSATPPAPSSSATPPAPSSSATPPSPSSSATPPSPSSSATPPSPSSSSTPPPPPPNAAPSIAVAGSSATLFSIAVALLL